MLESALVVNRFMDSLAQLETPWPATVLFFAKAERSWGTRTLDPAPVPPIPTEVVRNVDFISPKQNEAAALLGRQNACTIRDLEEAPSLADDVLCAGYRGVAQKLGHCGCYMATEGWNGGIPASGVEAAATTEAVDTLDAALAVPLSEDAPILKAARFARAAAAISVARPGEQNSLSTRNDAEKFMADTRRAVCSL